MCVRLNTPSGTVCVLFNAFVAFHSFMCINNQDHNENEIKKPKWYPTCLKLGVQVCQPQKPFPFTHNNTTPSIYIFGQTDDHRVRNALPSPVFGVERRLTYQIKGQLVAQPSLTRWCARKRRKLAQTARKGPKTSKRRSSGVCRPILKCCGGVRRRCENQNMERFTNLRVILAQGPC